MKVIIAGGRDYEFAIQDFRCLDTIHKTLNITEVVSGTARGADKCGEEWAENMDIPIKRFKPDWEKLGPKAGPIRNQQMADYADALIAFPGGKGTADMVRRAKAKGLKVYDLR